MLPRILTALFICSLCLISLPPESNANYLADISTYYQTPSSLPLNTIVEVACDWKWTGGGHDEEIQIIAMPLTNGQPSPGHWIEDSGNLSEGSGRVWPWFKIQSGAVVVDEILLTMETTLGKEVLLEYRFPVWFHFGPHAIRTVTVTPEGPERMAHGQLVNIDFIYETTQVGGIRISAVPITNGILTPNSTFSTFDLLSGSSGWENKWFSVTSGDVDIEAIRFVMWDASLTTPLHSFDLPCDYHFGSTAIQNIVLSTPTPASMIHGDRVYIDFDYVTDHPMDVKVYAIPQTDGANSPNHSVNPPVALPPMSGHGQNRFTITSELCDVDEIWFVMRDYFDHQILVDEFRLPVYYHYSGHKIEDVTLTPLAPAILSHDEWVWLTMAYTNNNPETGYVYTHPFTGPNPTPNLYGMYRTDAWPGHYYVNHEFRITSGEVLVDRLRFQMRNLDEDELWMSYFVDTSLYWGNSNAVSPVVEMPSSAAAVLHLNYPNPFNPQTTIWYELPAALPVDLQVYDLRGRLVRTLVSGKVESAGEHRILWDGRDRQGRGVSSGTYLYRLDAGGNQLFGRMALVR